MKDLTRRSFLASSVRAALFGAYASSGAALAQSASWSNWSGGQTCQPAGRYDIGSEGHFTLGHRKIAACKLGQTLFDLRSGNLRRFAVHVRTT